jgi:hypothetical protein
MTGTLIASCIVLVKGMHASRRVISDRMQGLAPLKILRIYLFCCSPTSFRAEVFNNGFHKPYSVVGPDPLFGIILGELTGAANPTLGID